MDSFQQYLSSSSNTFTSGDSIGFANQENVGGSTAYVNTALQALGWTGRTLTLGSVDADEQANVANALFWMLERVQRDVEHRRDLEQQLTRAKSDASLAQTARAAVATELGAVQRQVGELQTRLEAEQRRATADLARVAGERDAKARQLRAVLARDAQQSHALRKQERETERLRARLESSVNLATRAAKSGIELLNPVPRASGRRGSWKTGSGKAEESLMKDVVQSYEAKVADLAADNSALRAALQSLRRDVADIAAASPGPGLVDDASVTEEVLNLPFSMARDRFERHIRAEMSLIRQRLEQATAPPSKNDADDADDADDAESDSVRDKLAEYERVIREQEDLIELALHGGGGVGCVDASHAAAEPACVSTSELDVSHPDLAYVSEERRLLDEQKAAFEQERTRLTQAALELDRKRRELETEHVTKQAAALAMSTPVPHARLSGNPIFTSPSPIRFGA